jgi:hypothetical protein
MGAPKLCNRKNRNSPSRRRLLVVAVAIFLLVDVALVSLALTATKPVSSAGTVATAPTLTPPSAMATQSPLVEPVETVATPTVIPTRVLAALDGATAWRATTGGCPSASANPELTTDSGDNWEGFDASAGTDASSILAISIADAFEMSLVTLNSNSCAAQLVTTFVAGDAWKAYPERATAEWYVNPAIPGTVHTPRGDVVAPCTAVATLAATNDTSAAVLCLDASVFTTQDAGATWSTPGSVPGAAALAATAEGYGVAVANPANCVGVSLVTLSLGGALGETPGGCVAATVDPGETALSGGEDGTLWLWVDDIFARSTDGGVTWA